MRFSRRTYPLPAAFSLLELLVVVAIISLVAVFVIPAATTIVMGTELTRGSQIMVGQISLARQTAMTLNHPVEVRLLRFADPELPGESIDDPSSWKFRGVQLMEVLNSGVKLSLTKIERLPSTVAMNEGSYSSLLSGTAETAPPQKALTLVPANSTDPILPRSPKRSAQYQYVSFRFMPDGSTDLPANGKWYVTLLNRADQHKLDHAGSASTGNDPIKALNYFTLQVDPTSGTTRTFRPTGGAK